MTLKYIIYLTIIFTFIIIRGFSQPVVINLKCEESNSVANPDFYIDSIIDARIIKNTIGVVQKGLENRKESAAFSRSLPDEFLSCVLNRFPKENSNQKKLTLVVRDLWISEFSSVFSELGHLTLNLSFCVFDENGTGNVIYETNRHLEETYRKDVTKTHGIRIAKLLNESIDAFNNNQHFNIPKPFVVRDSPALLSETIQIGLYRDFSDFQNNLVTDSSVLIKRKINQKVFLNKSRYAQNPSKYFALFDGENLFISSSTYTLNGDYFAKVSSFGRYILIDDTVTPVLASSLLGSIGSELLKRRGVIIDMLDGLPKVLSEYQFLEIISQRPDLLEYYKSLNNTSFEVKRLVIERLNKS